MTIDSVIVGIVLAAFALMIVLVPRGAARARRETNRRRLELASGMDQPREHPRVARTTPDPRPATAREDLR